MSGDILYRVELRNAEQARIALAKGALPWIGEQLAQGRELVGEFRLLEDEITQRQRAYYHAVVLEEIAAFARPNGQQFPVKVWKEHLRATFLGFRVVTSINPITGRKVRRRVRVSTEDLGIAGYAKFIDQVIAFAATELGVQVSEPLPPELRPQRRRARAVAEGNVDCETGEILETTE